MDARNIRRSGGSKFAALLLAVVTLGGCSSEPAGTGSAAGAAGGNSNAAAQTASNAPVPGGMPGNMPQPMGMEDSIEGVVVAVPCFEKNPTMPAAEAKTCAQAAMVNGFALAVLGTDGVLYVNDEKADVRRNNKQLEFFISEMVTIQGQHIGEANRAKIGQTPVKQFRMKLVRRKKADGAAATNAAAGK